jgi:hypothetical protein
MEHPDTQILNSDEFAKRIVGTMFLPYIKGEDVWGIAKIYDIEAISMITDDQLSTSPSVVFRDPKVNYNIELEDGGTLLVEGKPSFVDHLAICEKGVWDKGGDASGIRIDNDSTATGEPRPQVITAKPDESELPPPVGANLAPAPNQQAIPPNILALVDGLNQFTDRLDRFMARRDLMVR